MASLNSLYIKKEVLETLLNVLTKKGEKGIELTVNISDTENQYGQNVSAWVSQSKEQRQGKERTVLCRKWETILDRWGIKKRNSNKRTSRR